MNCSNSPRRPGDLTYEVIKILFGLAYHFYCGDFPNGEELFPIGQSTTSGFSIRWFVWQPDLIGVQKEKVEADRIKESSTSQAIKTAAWFSYNNCRVTARATDEFAVMLSKIGSKNAVRFNYYDGTNTNSDSYQDFLSLLVHKQSEH